MNDDLWNDFYSGLRKYGDIGEVLEDLTTNGGNGLISSGYADYWDKTITAANDSNLEISRELIDSLLYEDRIALMNSNDCFDAAKRGIELVLAFLKVKIV